MARMAARLSFNTGCGSELIGSLSLLHRMACVHKVDRSVYKVDGIRLCGGTIWRVSLITSGLRACLGMVLSVLYRWVRWGDSPSEAGRGLLRRKAPGLYGALTALPGDLT
jgi:hypothetical protein